MESDTANLNQQDLKHCSYKFCLEIIFANGVQLILKVFFTKSGKKYVLYFNKAWSANQLEKKNQVQLKQLQCEQGIQQKSFRIYKSNEKGQRLGQPLPQQLITECLSIHIEQNYFYIQQNNSIQPKPNITPKPLQIMNQYSQAILSQYATNNQQSTNRQQPSENQVSYNKYKTYLSQINQSVIQFTGQTKTVESYQLVEVDIRIYIYHLRDLKVIGVNQGNLSKNNRTVYQLDKIKHMQLEKFCNYNQIQNIPDKFCAFIEQVKEIFGQKTTIDQMVSFYDKNAHFQQVKNNGEIPIIDIVIYINLSLLEDIQRFQNSKRKELNEQQERKYKIQKNRQAYLQGLNYRSQQQTNKVVIVIHQFPFYSQIQQHQVMMFNDFYKASKKYFWEMDKYIPKGSTVIQIQSYTARSITENEVLLMPWTNYYVWSVQKVHDNDGRFKYNLIRLHQLETPSKKHIVIWVDDIPKNNSQQIKSIRNYHEDYQLILFRGTRSFMIWLELYRPILQAIWPQESIRIIQDMSRQQMRGQPSKLENNFSAGQDLIKIINEFQECYNFFKQCRKIPIMTFVQKEDLSKEMMQSSNYNKYNIYTKIQEVEKFWQNDHNDSTLNEKQVSESD